MVTYPFLSSLSAANNAINGSSIQNITPPEPEQEAQSA
jgi:hypothetical protein